MPPQDERPHAASTVARLGGLFTWLTGVVALAVIMAVVVAVVRAESAVNVAPDAVVTASGQGSSDSGGATTVVDGRSGPGTPLTRQWAVRDDRGVWLQLAWATPQTLNRAVLFDLTSASSEPTTARLYFDDGSSASAGPLHDDGTGLAVPFAPRSVRSMLISLARPSGDSAPVGLAEVQVFTTGHAAQNTALPALKWPDCPRGTVVNVVAHPDDDLLFINPSLLEAIAARRCVVTIVVTAADNGQDAPYWQARQEGLQAAYAVMGESTAQWRRSQVNAAGSRVIVDTWERDTQTIALAHLRLPDGDLDGAGFGTTGRTSLEQLRAGDVSGLSSVDGLSFFTRPMLVATVRALLDAVSPTVINTLDTRPGQDDHSDHREVGLLVKAARPSVPVTHFIGYGSTSRPANVFGASLQAKRSAFYAYGAYDDRACRSDASCEELAYAAWLSRSYSVDE